MSEAIEQDQVPNYLDLSDEEIANMEMPSEAAIAVPVEEASPTRSDSEVLDDADDTGTATDTTFEGGTETQTDEPEAKKEEPSDAHKAFYEAVTASFNANGTQLTITEPSEIIKLMQMGANYSKKMGELKEPRKYLKMLEDAQLLDAEKIGFLIDVHNKNPEAIAKLVRDSGIDTYDLDSEEKANQYKPVAQAPAQSQMDLQDIVSELEHTPTYSQLIGVVTEQFDQASRTQIASEPSTLRILNEHMGNGVFNQIDGIMKRERALGRLNGMSDIDAYNAVGQYLYSNNLLVTQSAPPVPAPIVAPVAKPNPELNSRRQAAASPKGTVNPLVDVRNPLAMSDEEFAKLTMTGV